MIRRLREAYRDDHTWRSRLATAVLATGLGTGISWAVPGPHLARLGSAPVWADVLFELVYAGTVIYVFLVVWDRLGKKAEK